VPEPGPPIQNLNFQTQDLGLGGVLLVNGKSKVWFRPSKGLNVLRFKVLTQGTAKP
jgi:hypothetical protein